MIGVIQIFRQAGQSSTYFLASEVDIESVFAIASGIKGFIVQGFLFECTRNPCLARMAY